MQRPGTMSALKFVFSDSILLVNLLKLSKPESKSSVELQMLNKKLLENSPESTLAPALPMNENYSRLPNKRTGYDY